MARWMSLTASLISYSYLSPDFSWVCIRSNEDAENIVNHVGKDRIFYIYIKHRELGCNRENI